MNAEERRLPTVFFKPPLKHIQWLIAYSEALWLRMYGTKTPCECRSTVPRKSSSDWISISPDVELIILTPRMEELLSHNILNYSHSLCWSNFPLNYWICNSQIDWLIGLLTLPRPSLMFPVSFGVSCFKPPRNLKVFSSSLNHSRKEKGDIIQLHKHQRFTSITDASMINHY